MGCRDGDRIAAGRQTGGTAVAGAVVAQQAFERALADPPKVIGDAGTHLVSRTLGLLHSDRVAEATEVADFINQATIFMASRQARAWAAAVRGQSQLHSGHVAESWRDLREATSLGSIVRCSVWAQWCASGAVLAAAARGDVQLAASRAPPARPAPFGHLAIDPGGNTVEGASTINWSAAGLTIANGVTLTLNATRQLTVICNGGGSTHFIIDIAGYYL